MTVDISNPATVQLKNGEASALDITDGTTSQIKLGTDGAASTLTLGAEVRTINLAAGTGVTVDIANPATVKVKNGETAGGPDGARGRAGGGGVRGAAALGFGAATAAACALRRASKTFLTASCCRWRSRDDFSLSTRFEEAACAAPRATRQGSAAIVLWMGGVRDSCGGAAFEAPAGAADAERESICSTARRWPMERASSSLATAALGRGRAADGAAAGVHSWRMYRA